MAECLCTEAPTPLVSYGGCVVSFRRHSGVSQQDEASAAEKMAKVCKATHRGHNSAVSDFFIQINVRTSLVLSVLTANPFGCLKVRSLWSVIDGMLSSTKEERRAVGCVLKGDADQHVLDGTDQVLRIPRMLQERVEQLPHQVRGTRSTWLHPMFL